jgi:hypothetical protein
VIPRLLLVLTCALWGCVSPRAVLVNDKGEHVICATTSAGIVGSIVAQSRFDGCVAEAKEKGYRIESQRQ